MPKSFISLSISIPVTREPPPGGRRSRRRRRQHLSQRTWAMGRRSRWIPEPGWGRRLWERTGPLREGAHCRRRPRLRGAGARCRLRRVRRPPASGFCRSALPRRWWRSSNRGRWGWRGSCHRPASVATSPRRKCWKPVPWPGRPSPGSAGTRTLQHDSPYDRSNAKM